MKKFFLRILFYVVIYPIFWFGCKFLGWPYPPTYNSDGSINY